MERHRLNALVIPMARLQPDETEMAAMVVMVLWNLEGLFSPPLSELQYSGNFEYLSGVSQLSIETGRQYKSELFDELHEYYTKERGSSYAFRIATLSSIVHSVDVRLSMEKVVVSSITGGHPTTFGRCEGSPYLWPPQRAHQQR